MQDQNSNVPEGESIVPNDNVSDSKIPSNMTEGNEGSSSIEGDVAEEARANVNEAQSAQEIPLESLSFQAEHRVEAQAMGGGSSEGVANVNAQESPTQPSGEQRQDTMNGHMSQPGFEQEPAQATGRSFGGESARPQDPYSAQAPNQQQGAGSAWVPIDPSAGQQHPRDQYLSSSLVCAWRDVVNSPGWFGRSCLLGLVNCVPILNFFVTGYCMRWGKQLAYDTVAPMPKGIFEERNFVNGFFAFVISLVIGIIGGLASGIVELVPVLGFIAAIAIMLFMTIFEYLSIMKCAVADRLGAGFDISQIWQGLKVRFGELCAAALVPMLIVMFVDMILTFVLTIAFMFPLALQIADVTMYSYASLDSMIAIMLAIIPMVIVLWIVNAFLFAFAGLWTFRAVGHYVARYAPSWVVNPLYE